MKYLILILLISSCANCERKDCVDYCEKIKFGDNLKKLHMSVIREEDPNPKACYSIIDEIDPEITGSYCIIRDDR